MESRLPHGQRRASDLGVLQGLERTLSLLAVEGPALADLMKIRFYPFALRRGEGCWVEDEDGNTFLDLCAGAATMNLGYGDARLAHAIRGAMEGPWSTTSAVFAHAAEVQLAARLNSLIEGDTKVWFGTSGSEALDMLARFTRVASNRARLVAFVGADHGQTAASAMISGLSFHRNAASDDVVLLPYPNPYRCAHGPCDLSGCSLRCIDAAEATLAEQPRPAALFIEPIQSNGGDVVPPRNVLPALRGMCDASGTWLVLDEVKVGLGRTGALFAFEHSNVIPDAIALGKALGGGLPLSAVIGRSEILDVSLGGSASTLAAAPMPCAAALATLEALQDGTVIQNAAARGRELADGLRAALAESSIVGEIRGEGLLLGIELVESRAARQPASVAAAKVVFRCHELGALVIYTGLDSNVVELTPPLVISSHEVGIAIEILANAISDVEQGAVADDKIVGYSGW